ncbi:MAG: hypothetical protein A3J72_06795 [Nitrospirae bacterium RIFCSPHIGHO2_02_FULL_40_19]|nr:MAG: hypothetical protein A3J72_06795 [Nitrospirae bacterium RIFCSPHIGHO2_02_FULL_40_19]
MQIKDCLDEILNLIAENPFVLSQSLSVEERPPDSAFISGLITFTDTSRLHFKEFVVFKPYDFKVLKYGYNYLDKDEALIFRYDNALDPQAKKLSTYPEHKHTLKDLLTAPRQALREVLLEISSIIEAEK